MKIINVVVIVIVMCSSMAFAKTRYENVQRQENLERIKNYKLDLWDGEPKRPYKIIGEVKGTHPHQVLIGQSFMVNEALYDLKVAAIDLNADAVIRIVCYNPKWVPSPLDEGDFYEKNNMLPFLLNQPGSIECKGTAVKYK